MSKTQKFVNESIKLNWNFRRGGGSNQKPSRGGMDILWNIIMYIYDKCQRITNMDQKTNEGKNKMYPKEGGMNICVYPWYK